MQGIYQTDYTPNLPQSWFPSKAALKRFLADPTETDIDVVLLDTSFFNDGYSGSLYDFVGSVVLVGPDPYNDRRWYGTLTRTADGKVTVK